MVQDTVVGIIGFVLIVGSMAGVLHLQDEDGPPDIAGPPPQLGMDTWLADGCLALEASWQVPVDQLAEHTGPWEPRDVGSGQGRFTLLVYDCQDTVVSGLDDGRTRGGAALIQVVAPEDPRNVSAGTWLATPELIVPSGGELAPALVEHAFPVTDGQASLMVTSLVLGDRIAASLSTEAGSLEVTALTTGMATDTSQDRGILSDSQDRFAVLNGTREATGSPAGQAAVTTEGETWVSRLSLSPTPDSVMLYRQASWDYDVWDRPLG